ncbi:MAG: sterol desaturase family protein, partial [Candidatus Binatia bacterium]
MTEAEFQIVRTVGFVLAVGAVLALERLRPHAGFRGSWRVNGALWSVNLLVMGLVCGACACVVSRWAQASGVGVLNTSGAPLWVAIAVTIVGLDFVSYVWHRANHRIELLWRFHRVHHSDETFTASTALRFHPSELVLSLPLRLGAVAALGAPVVGVVAFEIAFMIANLVEHGDIDLPLRLERRLDRVFVTPALHRRHHSRRGTELNTNFGTIFTFWDRLLRSYGESSSSVRVRPGLAGLSAPESLRSALALPFRPAWKARTLVP